MEPQGRKDYNPYKVLGLENGCPVQEVKKKYRQLALKLHPDRKPDDPKAVELFELATKAYQFLLDPLRKREYDLELERKKKKEYNLKHSAVKKLRKVQRRGVYSKRNINDPDFDAFIKECEENYMEFFSKIEKLK